MSNVTEIRAVGAALIHAARRTDMTKFPLISALDAQKHKPSHHSTAGKTCKKNITIAPIRVHICFPNKT